MENQDNIHRGVVLQQKSIISTEYDGYEVQPCKEEHLPDGTEPERFITVCEPNEAEFWSVYGHLKEGGCECVADCLTGDIANRFAKWCDDTLAVLIQVEKINNSDELIAAMEQINEQKESGNTNIIKILDFDAAEVSTRLINQLVGECDYKDMELGEDIYSIESCDELTMWNEETFEAFKAIATKCEAADCGYFRIINLEKK